MKPIIKNVLSLGVGRILSQVLSLVAGLVLIKWLSPSWYGEYKYGFGLFNALMFLPDMGMGVFLFRLLSQRPGEARRWIPQSLYIR